MRTLAIFFLLGLVSCGESYTKMPSGVEYRIVASGYGGCPREGQVIKMHVRQVYADSVLSDTRRRQPQYQMFDSAELSADAYHIFSQVRPGDSLVFRLHPDSAFKTARPPFAKKGVWLVTYVKVLGILSEYEARGELEMEKKAAAGPAGDFTINSDR